MNLLTWPERRRSGRLRVDKNARNGETGAPVKTVKVGKSTILASRECMANAGAASSAPTKQKRVF